MKIQVGVSNRHVHLKKEHLKILFGNKELKEIKKLNQPGQFVSDFFVDLITNKNEIKHVRIIGPVREYTQVEISKTDAYFLGVDPPIRTSGDIKNSCPIIIKGPNGILKLEEGLIIADRHIHITPDQVKFYHLENKNKVDVLINGEKGGIISNVNLKVADNSYLELHLDTDDANAHFLKPGDIVEIIM